MSMTDRTPASPVEDRLFAGMLTFPINPTHEWGAYFCADCGSWPDEARARRRCKGPDWRTAALQAQDHTITKGGLDVERLAEALHVVENHSHDHSEAMHRIPEAKHPIGDNLTFKAEAIVREYAALEPTHD